MIIGNGSLPIRCAEIILETGHRLNAIISPDQEVARWARANQVDHFGSIEAFQVGFSGAVENLFSINNQLILTQDVLRLPEKYAINYHDSLLPRYAGTHATSWALLNGETEHGITWHLIEDKVDAGNIVKQRTVAITDDETALSLNSKCFEAAIDSFSELVNDLEFGRVAPIKQDFAQRSFYRRYKRPSNAGIISWMCPALEISRLVRALNFGNHPNELGKAKTLIGTEFFVVNNVEILETSSSARPGTIVRIGQDGLQVASSDKDVLIKSISTVDGVHLSISELPIRTLVYQGSALTDLEDEVAERVDWLVKETAAVEKFWVKKLSEVKPVAPPYASKSSLGVTNCYSVRPLIFPEEFLEYIDRVADSDRLRVSLVTAFGALLFRLTGRESFSVGYTNQNLIRKIGDLGGLFATTVPLEIVIDHSQSLLAAVSSIREEIDQVNSNTTYLRDVRSRFPNLPSGDHLDCSFPVSFAEVDEIERYLASVESDLTLAVSNEEYYWVFNSNRLEEEDVERISKQLQEVLKSFARDADSEISRLPILPESEKSKLLCDWNAEHVSVVPDACIHSLFEEQVERTPEATALIVGDQRLSYWELNGMANLVAARLQKLGAGPEVLIAVCADRTVEAIVGILGILKSGAAYLPLDPAYPKERLLHMLTDSGASVLLTKRGLNVELGPHKAARAYLEELLEDGESKVEVNPVSAVQPSNLAYVIYTSGSTGKPKGVAIEHRNTVTFLTWVNSVFSAAQLKGTLASTSFCFDLSVFEIFAPLSCGGTIVLVDNILHLASTIAAQEVTLINTVPSAIAELADINGIPATVTTVNLAGEPLKTPLVKQIYKTGTVQKVFDLYGPTEDTTYSTYALRDLEKATIGRPINNTQAYVLDSNLQPVPIGIHGELFLGGDGVARGYLNRPELTAERFITISLGQHGSKRVYRTGDLVRYLPSGELEYLGRMDNQVKIRGFRVELGEIESAISNYEDVREAVVQAYDEGNTKRLVAYVVSTSQSTVKTADLRKYLVTKLPDHMIPSLFVQLERMPLTPNGKVDRKALPAPETSLSTERTGFEGPKTETERVLVEIWGELFGIENISIHDNFFELGGHSLLAIRMLRGIKERFGQSPPLAVLFEAGTVKELAESLATSLWEESESSLVPIQTKGTNPPLFCFHAGGGNVLFYNDLAKHLGKDQPVYGLQARRIGGRQVAHDTVEEMAEFYLSEITKFQPEGPYYLCGSSFGGFLAFETAQILQRRGKEVGLVALFDTNAPGYPILLNQTTPIRKKIYLYVRRFQHHHASLVGLGRGERLPYVISKLKKKRLKFERKLRKAYLKVLGSYYLKFRNEKHLPERYIQLESKIGKANSRYRPEKYSGTVTLFRAEKQPLGILPDATLGWQGIAANLEIHEVPGHHGSIVSEPYVRPLARILTKCIDITLRKIEPKGYAAAAGVSKTS